MELTLDNLVNYILEQEYRSFTLMNKYGDVLGNNNESTSRKRAIWHSYYEIAKQFNLLDRLIR